MQAREYDFWLGPFSIGVYEPGEGYLHSVPVFPSGNPAVPSLGSVGGGAGGARAPQASVIDAVMRSSDRIVNKDCAGLFLAPEANTPEQRQLLSQQLEMLADDGSFRTVAAKDLPAGTPAGVAGFTTGTFGLIYFVEGGSFFTGQLNGQPLGGALQGLSSNQAQELMVIHEYLHYWGIGPDNANQEITLANGHKVIGSEGVSREVRENCFK
jgi:hypothetical protein